MKDGAELWNFRSNPQYWAPGTYDGTIMNSWKANRPPAWELYLVSQVLLILT